jgi:hypothetical protein
VHNNPYKAHTSWPPENIASLPAKQQFHYEKTYRRRAKLKWARPTWRRWTGIIRDTAILGVVVWTVLFMEPPDGQRNPFVGVRRFVFGKVALLRGESEEGEERVETVLERKARERKERRIGFWRWLWMDPDTRPSLQRVMAEYAVFEEYDDSEEEDDEDGDDDDEEDVKRPLPKQTVSSGARRW